MYLYQIALLFLIADGLSGVTVQKSPQECTVDAYTCTLYLFVVNHPYLFIYFIYLFLYQYEGCSDSKLAWYPAHVGE